MIHEVARNITHFSMFVRFKIKFTFITYTKFTFNLLAIQDLLRKWQKFQNNLPNANI